MKYLINNINLSLDDDVKHLEYKIAKKLNINRYDLLSYRIVKQSIDARRKSNINFVYSVVADVSKAFLNMDSDIKNVEEPKEEIFCFGKESINHRPVVIGTGPAGLFAGLFLAQNGYKPIVIERGESVENRTKIVKTYWETGELNPNTNVQFGEGGAGTFSDGKLTTRISDPMCDKVLEILVQNGAPPEILIKAKPHIGSDNLCAVVKNIRERIISLGGTVLFNSTLTDIQIKNAELSSITLNGNTKIETNVMILAIGHSSRDTLDMLYKREIRMSQKPFSIGFRIEHPQELINKAQYGPNYTHPKLPNAEYQLFEKIGNRTAYTFCMCPGGIVVASSSEEGTIVTNGMSEFSRNRENANAAFVVSVNPNDFGSVDPLAGVAFQRKWEKIAFEVAGSTGGAPVQLVKDFVNNVKSKNLGKVQPSYTGHYEKSNLNEVVPEFVSDVLKQALKSFNRKLKGFDMDDAILTGIETRTSSPIRIERDSNFSAIGINGIYPCGEGAGYAGGIMSAAVDGIKNAVAIMSKYSRVEN